MSEFEHGDVFALFDDNHSSENRSVLFTGLADFILARDNGDVDFAFKKINQGNQLGLYAAGMFSYELAGALDKKMSVYPVTNSDFPLIYIGLFKNIEYLDDCEVDAYLRKISGDKIPRISDIYISQSRGKHLDNIGIIKENIRNGITYQVNYTFKSRFNVEGSPVRFYQNLRAGQPVEFGAFLNFPDVKILSRSPELFFRKKGKNLTVRPMKGTCPRGKTAEQDLQLIRAMGDDEKSLAENVMIVDLLRNDLGRVAEPGSVKVDKLFNIETYKTLHQMTSTISCRVQSSLSPHSLFRNLFPCGSVTGAPKIKTMEIIRELEDGPRGIYTGAVGYIFPNNNMSFSVPIRTITMRPNGKAELGLGSGVTNDSDPSSEYGECLLKGRFAFGQEANFSLLECFLFDPKSGIRNLCDHLDRMENSAEFFLFSFIRDDIEKQIHKVVGFLKTVSKIKIILDKLGRLKIETQEIKKNSDDPTLLTISDQRTCSGQITYLHKTTNRYLYDQEYEKHHREYGAYDVLFLNERDEFTEASRHNLFLRFGDKFYTPPVECGLLNGIGRMEILRNDLFHTEERVLYRDDIFSADEIILTNSVRSSRKVVLHDGFKGIPDDNSDR